MIIFSAYEEVTDVKINSAEIVLIYALIREIYLLQ